MVVPKVSPSALRPNRTIFTVSMPTRHACWASSLTANLCLPQVGHRSAGPLVFKRIRSVYDPYRLRPAFAHASVPMSADQAEHPGHLSQEFVAHEVPGPFVCMIKC